MRTVWNRSWWVFLFLGILSIFYLHGMHQKQQEFAEIKGRFYTLEHERLLATQEHEELLLQIRSQNDPAWIEMTLKKNLGLVPEGQVKVYFEKCSS